MSTTKMRQGDFSSLAKEYINRPGYSNVVIKAILKLLDSDKNHNFKVAEIGAGTGKLTEILLNNNLQVDCSEPNDAMRAEGVRLTNHNSNANWVKGQAEKTNLPSDTYDWVVMASSFHWADHKKALPEFKRILKPNGALTVMWNPRDLSKNILQQEINDMIISKVPNLKRKSSGSEEFTKEIPTILSYNHIFDSILFMEACHVEKKTPEEYLGLWKSVNDIQAQAGPEVFKEIISTIEQKITHLAVVDCPYKTRAWTAKLNTIHAT